MDNNERQIPLINFIPLIIIIVIIPLITYGKVIELPLEEANFWKGGTTHVDFFSYYKSTFLIIVTLTALLSYTQQLLNKTITLQNNRSYNIPIIIYSIFVILSTFFSKYRNVALLGFVDMYQGMSVLLCYILLTFIAINFPKSQRDIKIIVYSYVVLNIIIGVLGLSQYFGYDFLQTSLGKMIITPQSLREANIKFTFGKYTIYATMYNTNFVGSFGAIMLPLTTMLYLYYKGKKQIFFLISAILSFTTWLGCNSRAGYVGVITATFLSVILFSQIIKEKYKKIILLTIIFAIIVIIFNFASNGRVAGQFSRLNPLNEVEKIKKTEEEQLVRFEDISISINELSIKTSSETLSLIINGYDISFKNEDGNILETYHDKGNDIKFTDKRYENYIFNKAEDSPFIIASIYKRPLNLYITEEGNLKTISMNYKLTEPVTAPRVKLFDKRETFASNRGYIWSRTIPMLKETLIIGYGPDNYCLMFPQEDYVGRFNTGIGMTNIVVDKPHNMYMQTAVNTGGVSLLALIFIWLLYIVDSIKLFNKRIIGTYLEYMGAAAFLSITAYLTAGMFNDNIVSVAPLFWIIFGLAICINRMIKIDNF